MLSIIIQARLRSTVTEERMLSLITGSSVIEGTLSGYFVLEAENPLDYGSALLSAAELPLSSAKPALPTEDCSEKELRHIQIAFAFLCLTSGNRQVSLVIFTFKFHTTQFELKFLRTLRVFF